jgi:dTDP-glucose 4,6-dehydratase
VVSSGKPKFKIMKLLITGGAGFIGSNFVNYWVSHHGDDSIVVLDALTYAGNLENLEPVKDKITFIRGSINNQELVNELVEGVDIVIHFAAESHVDRSVLSPDAFIQTNIIGTYNILEAVKKHSKRLHHVSTDEVFGQIPLHSKHKFNEESPYNPVETKPITALNQKI